VIEDFFQVPWMVRPFVAIQAFPLPMFRASRRCLFEPSLSGPNETIMITTFLGATCLPSAGSICLVCPEMPRR
jgi:hypothetical protein